MREPNGREREWKIKRENVRERRCGNERREGTRAGMSRLLVSQTRGRYLADQWQSTGRSKILAGSNSHSLLTRLDDTRVSVFRTDEV